MIPMFHQNSHFQKRRILSIYSHALCLILLDAWSAYILSLTSHLSILYSSLARLFNKKLYIMRNFAVLLHFRCMKHDPGARWSGKHNRGVGHHGHCRPDIAVARFSDWFCSCRIHLNHEFCRLFPRRRFEVLWTGEAKGIKWIRHCHHYCSGGFYTNRTKCFVTPENLWKKLLHAAILLRPTSWDTSWFAEQIHLGFAYAGSLCFAITQIMYSALFSGMGFFVFFRLFDEIKAIIPL